jgi:hypothetical protein
VTVFRAPTSLSCCADCGIGSHDLTLGLHVRGDVQVLNIRAMRRARPAHVELGVALLAVRTCSHPAGRKRLVERSGEVCVSSV